MRTFFTLLVVCFTWSFSITGQTLHALIIADTKDSFIGTGCVTDIRTMQEQINTIGTAINYPIQLTVLRDDQFSQTALTAYIESLKLNPDDVLLTYYTGHGYTTTDRLSNWPLLKMSGPTIALDQLHAQLGKKGARFCLTIGDCCNNIARPRSVTVRNLVVEDKKTVATQYAALFRQARGDVLVASCSRGECSYADATEGSYYTRAFKTALDCAVHYNNTVNWREVLADAQNRVMTFIGPRGRQTPLYQLNLVDAEPATTVLALSAGVPNPETPQINRATSYSAALSAKPSVATPPTGLPVQAPPLAIDVINRYLNDLADEQVPTTTRLKRMREADQFFDPQARVSIYVDQTLVEVQPIGQVIERLCLNAARIRIINLIENRSQRTPDASHYAMITIQEIWE